MKAKRATIELGDRELEVFQLPDGSYWLSQTQVAEAVGKAEFSFRRFSTSKWLKALPGMDSESMPGKAFSHYLAWILNPALLSRFRGKARQVPPSVVSLSPSLAPIG